MIYAVFMFLGGLILLLKGSDLFVESSVKIAKYLGVSEIVIGLTLVSVGTSLPETASSLTAAASGDTGLIVGNVVGSNIANIGLILGLCGVMAAIKVSEEFYYRDGFILLGTSFIFYWFAEDGVINALDGLVLLAVFTLYVGYLFKFKPGISRLLRLDEYVVERFDVEGIPGLRLYRRIVKKGLDAATYRELIHRGFVLQFPERLIKGGLSPATYRRVLAVYRERLKSGLLRELALMAAGFVAIYFGAKYLVAGSVSLADFMGVSQNIIGLTMIAVGTSLPELMVSFTSVRKGFGGVILGNIMGSNIANITLVAGLSALVSPIRIPSMSLSYTIPFMLLISFTAFIVIRRGWEVRRSEGFMLLGSYVFFIAWIVSHA